MKISTGAIFSLCAYVFITLRFPLMFTLRRQEQFPSLEPFMKFFQKKPRKCLRKTWPNFAPNCKTKKRKYLLLHSTNIDWKIGGRLSKIHSPWENVTMTKPGKRSDSKKSFYHHLPSSQTTNKTNIHKNLGLAKRLTVNPEKHVISKLEGKTVKNVSGMLKLQPFESRIRWTALTRSLHSVRLANETNVCGKNWKNRIFCKNDEQARGRSSKNQQDCLFSFSYLIASRVPCCLIVKKWTAFFVNCLWKNFFKKILVYLFGFFSVKSPHWCQK